MRYELTIGWRVRRILEVYLTVNAWYVYHLMPYPPHSMDDPWMNKRLR